MLTRRYFSDYHCVVFLEADNIFLIQNREKKNVLALRIS